MKPEQIIRKHYCSFSEAIRAAGGVFRQSFYGSFAREILKLNDGQVCAIEGGVRMLGVSKAFAPDGIYSFVEQQYPYLNTVSDCPCCVAYGNTLTNLIWHLNDHHRRSFEQIADWLESEEEKLGFVTLIEGETLRTQPEVSEIVMV